MLKMYDMQRSGNAYKVRLMLGLLGLDHVKQTVDLSKKEQMAPWYLAINPLHTVPVLDDDGVIIRDSQAGLVYLAAKFDAARTWYPADAKGMGEVQQWLAYANNEILHKLAAARAIGLGLRAGNLAEAQEGARPVLAFMEQSLTGRDWLVGSNPTIADVACYPYPALIGQAGITHDAYPAIAAWCRRIESLPGYVPLPPRPPPPSA
jgi:glutathione S-transferase